MTIEMTTVYPAYFKLELQTSRPMTWSQKQRIQDIIANAVANELAEMLAEFEITVTKEEA